MKTISLRDANQGFARCIREVESGEEFVITRNGTPVARLAPISGRRVLTPEQEAALAQIEALTATGWAAGLSEGKFDRDALYER